ncbi:MULTISPECIES: IclR family transcriptional regulator [unclassified Sporosarcina]|uniref:IclR family transcriptional regulator n=1 Tax=unclassified Sporosarcina TaxID=2647733 RepID=UPI001E2F92A6|nr:MULTISPECIES: IclR family transcriptional regulator [unclassified Sporosarcina]
MEITKKKLEKQKSDNEKYLSNSILRGLEVLKMFSVENQTLSLAEIASNLGVSRTTPYRILYTLEECGYIYQDSHTKRYGLRPKVLELGYTYLNSLELPELAAPYLEKLRDETGMSSHMGILDGNDIVYIARYPARSVATITINVGSHLPVHATAMGKCLLAHLPEENKEELLSKLQVLQIPDAPIVEVKKLRDELQSIKEKGYVFHKGEFETGVWSVACPIFGKDNKVIAAINIAITQHAANEELMEEKIIPAVCQVAREISSFMVLTI